MIENEFYTKHGLHKLFSMSTVTSMDRMSSEATSLGNVLRSVYFIFHINDLVNRCFYRLKLDLIYGICS